ncbi:MAG: carboxypeptidase-like regulatory domain-containing protein, partial [Verrucomicrobiota bacterium]
TRAGVPGVTVGAYTLDSKQLVEKTTTDQAGKYRLPGLDPNKYELVVEKPGFRVDDVTTARSKPLGIDEDVEMVFSGTPVTLTEISVLMPDGTPAQSKKTRLGGVGPETIIIEYFRFRSTRDYKSCQSWPLPRLPAQDLLREGAYIARAVFPDKNLISDFEAVEVQGDQKLEVVFQLKPAGK